MQCQLWAQNSGGRPHTLRQVDDDPVPQEGHGQALEEQGALSAQSLAAQDSPHRLLLGLSLLHDLCEFNCLVTHQGRWSPEQAPSLCSLECLQCSQRIHGGLGNAHNLSTVLLAEGVGLGQVLERCDLEGVVVGQDDALPHRLPLAHGGALPRVLCGAPALLDVERAGAPLRGCRHVLLLHIRVAVARGRRGKVRHLGVDEAP